MSLGRIQPGGSHSKAAKKAGKKANARKMTDENSHSLNLYIPSFILVQRVYWHRNGLLIIQRRIRIFKINYLSLYYRIFRYIV